MDSSVKLLLTINDSVKGILMELKLLKELKYFVKFDIHLYEEAIQTMSDKIDIFYEAFSSGILNHRAISLSILNILNLHFNEIQSMFKKIKNWHHKVSKKGIRPLFTLCINKPSKMKKLLQKNMDSITPHLYQIQELERTIFGTAIRIKQHILRKAWMLVGANQLNDSFLPKNLFCENLYMLLKTEGGGELKRKDFWKDKIRQFVDELDGSACTDIDNKLSIAELNEISDELINVESVMDLILNATKKPEPCRALMLTNTHIDVSQNDENDDEIENENDNETDNENENENYFLEKSKAKNYFLENNENENENENENDNNENENDNSENKNENEKPNILMIEDKSELKEIIKEIDLNLIKQISVNNQDKIMIPKCQGYGANWPSKLCNEFIIPELPNERYQLFFVKIKCKAYDQMWGGTGHSQVRYQINDEMPKTGFSVNIQKNPDNDYEIKISGEKVKVGDKIKIWACCPPWAGWKIIIDQINAFVYYS
jgi:hypothetical protein